MTIIPSPVQRQTYRRYQSQDSHSFLKWVVKFEKCNVGIADLNSLSLFECDIFKAPGLEQSLQQVQVLSFLTVDTWRAGLKLLLVLVFYSVGDSWRGSNGIKTATPNDKEDRLLVG